MKGLLTSAPSIDLHEILRVLDDFVGEVMRRELSPDVNEVSGVLASLRERREGVFGRYDMIDEAVSGLQGEVD